MVNPMSQSRPDRGAFTIAVGKPIFLRMAIALARSFVYWNRDTGIEFAIVTDKPISECPVDLTGLIKWIEVEAGAYGTGFAPKLYLDQMAPANHSLFIDADCLCVRSLELTFERFKGKDVSVVGTNWSEGEWFGDVLTICRRLQIPHFPYLNGGIYYIEPGPVASRVFEKARALHKDYDELGFVRLRNRENDEVLISAAMAIHGQEPIEEDGTIMNTLMDAPGGLELDVLAGRAVLYNPRDHPNKARGHELRILRPAIMHMNDMDIAHYPYCTQVLMLELTMKSKLPTGVARGVAIVVKSVPELTKRWLRDRLRSTYHRLFGPSKVRPTSR
jgi:hypothetical protein